MIQLSAPGCALATFPYANGSLVITFLLFAVYCLLFYQRRVWKCADVSNDHSNP